MIGELERVGDSAGELGQLLEWVDRAHASLVVLDVGVDTTSREGALAARVFVSITGAARTDARPERQRLAGQPAQIHE